MERAEVGNAQMILAMAELGLMLAARAGNHLVLTSDELLRVFGPRVGERRFHIVLEKGAGDEVHLYVVPPDEPTGIPA